MIFHAANKPYILCVSPVDMYAVLGEKSEVASVYKILAMFQLKTRAMEYAKHIGLPASHVVKIDMTEGEL